MSSELRQNRLTGQWVIIAPERGDRPRQFDSQHGEAHTKTPAHREDCPFCTGNEAMLPDIILQLPGATDSVWQTRVVPNKYPMLTPNQGRQRQAHGLSVGMPGYGHHEVIIEHPQHNRDLAHMTTPEVTAVIETYHRRYVDLIHNDHNFMVIIFRNHGPRAGTSIQHPHSQLVVTGVVPQHIRWREDVAQRYFDTWGCALLGDMLADELESGTGIIDANESFVAFVPYAAEVPFEVWIVPRQQQADFGAITDRQKADFAAALRDVLRRLSALANDPDYNYVLHSAVRYKADEPHLRWYLQVRPRLVTPAGFEIGSGILVNPSLPEDDASALRSVSLAAVP